MADGRIVFETAVDSKGMQKDLHGIQHSTGGLSSAMGKLSKLIAATFTVKKVVQFGAACVKLGSDLQEVQNVVDVTFGSLSGKVDEFAKNAIFTTGLSETMAKKYMGTFGAMAKAFGFSTDESFEMSKALTQLSGDVASFYNLSQDEAFTKLKSVFTGETESLKDLGIVMTQAQLDQYALSHGFGSTTKSMTEQQKVALRHRFVLDQLKLAAGDFIRTSDGWANQTRILSVQFQQLKASIGQGLISALTPVIKVINIVLSKLMALANAFRSLMGRIFGSASGGSGGGQAMADGMNAAAGAADNLGQAVGGAGAAAKKAKRELAGFDELTILGSDDPSGGGGGGGGALDMLPEDTGAFDVDSDKVQTFLDKLSAFKDVWQDIKDTVAPIWEFMKEQFTVTVESMTGDLGFFGERMGESTDNIKGIFHEVCETVQDAWKVVKPLLSLGFDTFRTQLSFVSKLFSVTLKGLLGALNGFLQIFNGHMTGDWSKIWEGAKTVFKSFGEWIIDVLAVIATAFGVDFDTAKQSIINAINGIIKALNAMISGMVGAFNWVSQAVSGMSFNIPDWVPFVGGKTFGISLPTFTAPQIPLLARGAVIPPNREFMAVLGDQSHGRNLEAPEDLIRQIVREESGSGDRELLEAILEAIVEKNLNVILDGRKLAQTVTREQRRMQIAGGY